MRALWYLAAYLIPATAILGIYLGGWWLLATPIFLFALTPIMDQVIGTDEENLDAAGESSEKSNRTYDWVVRGWVPIQIAVLTAGLWLVGQDASPAEIIGMIYTVGMLGGIGINVAHELMHRKGALDRALAEVLMTSVSYTHFCVEHVHGHHKNVATPHDPATARLGESLYRFLPRSIFGGMKSFWGIEARIAERRGYGRFDLRNRRFRYPLVWALVLGAVGLAFGPLAIVFFVAQSIVGFTLLEIINYLEHYGLQRKELRPGRFERVQPAHSWNSAHLLSRLYLFGLPRHSDHHYMASRPYPILRHHAEAPQLPAGYATMFLVAMVPPLWRSVMDHRVLSLRGEQPARGPMPNAEAQAA